MPPFESDSDTAETLTETCSAGHARQPTDLFCRQCGEPLHPEKANTQGYLSLASTKIVESDVWRQVMKMRSVLSNASRRQLLTVVVLLIAVILLGIRLTGHFSGSPQSAVTVPPTTTDTLITPLADGWVHFSGPGNRFSIDLPGAPELVPLQSGGTTTTWDYGSYLTSYVIGVDDDDLSNTAKATDDARLDDALNNAKISLGGEITTSTLSTVGGRREINGVVESATVTKYVRAAIYRNHIYAIALGTTSPLDKTTFDRVADSLTVPGKASGVLTR